MAALERVWPQAWPLGISKPVIWGLRGSYDSAVGVRTQDGDFVPRGGDVLGGVRESVDDLLQRAAKHFPGVPLTLCYAESKT